eukprot:CAMPEP_0171463436 /NCGR_PEP_ID=MMETSP0945-20130129/7108_1 /TAXON_ID=109269 /ORGANISM="Vaucheria litorea, Strain CCMP2940" /LENGTH=114 /DNA_ID=CAMNT_0011990229 /DNA_START=30 /DNA_END=374 /DNA_ORIENTATION=+
MRRIFFLFTVINLLIADSLILPKASSYRNAPNKLRMAENSFLTFVNKLYNEITPWGDSEKGFTLQFEKRDKMVLKYMSKTGLSKEEAEVEVDEYLKDKEKWLAKQRAIDAKEMK